MAKQPDDNHVVTMWRTKLGAGLRCLLATYVCFARPRDHQQAKNLAMLALVVPVLAIVISAIIDAVLQHPVHFLAALYEPEVSMFHLVGLPIILGATGWQIWRASPTKMPYILLPSAIGGAGLVCALSTLGSDAAVTGQIFFILPVLYAAYSLRIGAALVTFVVTAVCQLLVTTSVLPLAKAMDDWCTCVVITGGMVWSIIRSREAVAEAERELTQASQRDALTQLANRKKFDQDVAKFFALRSADDQAALLIVDIDHFKKVNDTFGHAAGDDVLCSVARALEQAGGAHAQAARLGGDELVLFWPGCTQETAVTAARRLVAQVRSAPIRTHQGAAIQVTLSVGVAVVPGDAGSAVELYRVADEALYVAKRSGRNRVGLVDESAAVSGRRDVAGHVVAGVSGPLPRAGQVPAADQGPQAADVSPPHLTLPPPSG